MAFCGACGQRLNPEDLFCGECGQPVQGITKARQGEAAEKAPSERVQEVPQGGETPGEKKGWWKKPVIFTAVILAALGGFVLVQPEIPNWVQRIKEKLGQPAAPSAVPPNLEAKTPMGKEPSPPAPPTGTSLPVAPLVSAPLPSPLPRPAPPPPTAPKPAKPQGAATDGVGYLGVKIQDVTPELVRSMGLSEHVGALVREVAPKGPAEVAGIRAGDVVVKFKGKRINGAQELRDMVVACVPGKRVPVEVDRDGRKLQFSALIQTTEREVQAGKGGEARTEEERKGLARAYHDKGAESMDRGDFRAAIEHFKQAVAHDPQEPFFHAELGRAYYEAGAKEAAVQELKKAVSMRPHYYPYYLLGMIFWEQGRFDEAIGSLREAVRLRPADLGDTVAHGLLGHALMQQRRVQEALEVLTKGYQMDHKSPLTVYLLAGCYDQTGYAREAVRFYGEYLNLRHNDAEMNRIAQERLTALTRGR